MHIRDIIGTASGAARPENNEPKGSDPLSNDPSIGDDDSERRGSDRETIDSGVFPEDDMTVGQATQHRTSSEAMSQTSSEAQARGEKDEIESWPVPQSDGDDLTAPDPRPGFVQRWVRLTLGNDTDQINWSRMMRQGYRPRHPDTLTEKERGLYTIRQAGNSAYVQIEDLILCEIPEHHHRAIRKSVDEKTRQQHEATMDHVRQASQEGEAAGAPAIQADLKSKVSVGSRRPPVMDD